MKLKFFIALSFTTVLLLAINLKAFSQFTEWTNYSFANDVNAIAEEDSLLWIGTDVGLACYIKTTQNTTYFDRSNSPLHNDKITQ